MKTGTAVPFIQEHFMLGEGPCWNAETGELSWVDIKTGTLHILDRDGHRAAVQTGQYLGAAVPAQDGRFIALMTTGIYSMNRNEVTSKLAEPEKLEIFQRFNDAKCDPAGRLWAGTMPLFMQHVREGGKVYRYADGKCELTGLSAIVPNGMAWTADGKTMYLVETAFGNIDRLDYDPETGTAVNRRTVIHIDGGVPDGMTIDAEDKLWVAVWGAGEVRRYDPETAEILETVTVGCAQVSSCCFGESNLETLFITTSAEGDDSGSAGYVFKYETGVRGTGTSLFRYER